MHRSLLVTLFLFILILTLAIFVSFNNEKNFSLGLDLAGGTKITYSVDTSEVPKEEISDRITSLKAVIERRINSLGVKEPLVYTESSSLLTGLDRKFRLVVELPGVTDAREAIDEIGDTPFLEFKKLNRTTNEYDDIGINGGHVKGASFAFQQGASGNLTNSPIVSLRFNGEGEDLFRDFTGENVGEVLGIFLDGYMISNPVIRERIPGGVTQISGNFTIESAKSLAGNLNVGALPLPIKIEETQSVSPTLGEETLSKSVKAALISFVLIILLISIVYKFYGFIAFIGMLTYISIMLALWKLIPVTLTAAGLAGFVMSIGFAVDSNILIYERIRDEIRDGKSIFEALENGFKKAWVAVRDGNVSSLIIALLLFWFGTSVVKGFAFVFALGIIVSMFSSFYFVKRIIFHLVGKISDKFFKVK